MWLTFNCPNAKWDHSYAIKLRQMENQGNDCYCCNVPIHPSLCIHRQMASISASVTLIDTFSSSLQLNTVSGNQRCGRMLWIVWKLVKCALTKPGGVTQSGLSRSLNTLAHKSKLLYCLVYVCSVTCGLIKVKWRTHSSGYTWYHLSEAIVNQQDQSEIPVGQTILV